MLGLGGLVLKMPVPPGLTTGELLQVRARVRLRVLSPTTIVTQFNLFSAATSTTATRGEGAGRAQATSSGTCIVN